MGRLSVLIFVSIIFYSCFLQRENLNESLLEAYKNGDYTKCLKLLKKGADGRIELNSGYSRNPLLLDICIKYINTGFNEFEELLDFYIMNRKEAFEDRVFDISLKQTVGSYIIRLADFELLQKLVSNDINIFSHNEDCMHSYFYELARKAGSWRVYSEFFDDYKDMRETYSTIDQMNTLMKTEKKKRMKLLIDTGVDVTLTDKIGRNVLFLFKCYPFEEDYTDILDRILEKGIDINGKDNNGDSSINYNLGPLVFEHNSEAYLEYLISRGLEITEYDLARWESNMGRYNYIGRSQTEEEERMRMDNILKILENAINQDKEK